MSEKTASSEELKDTEVELKIVDKQNEKEIASLEELQPGDHAVIAFNDKQFCHVIVENVEVKPKKLQIIFYQLAESSVFAENAITDQNNNPEKVEKSKEKNIGVKESAIEVDFDKFRIYKVIYDEKSEKTLEPSETIKRAREHIGSAKYNVFMNNDEHFVIYCKTGKAGKLFLIDPKDVDVKNVLGGSIFDRIKGSLTMTGTHVLLVSTAKHISSSFPRNIAATSLPVVAEAAGSIIGIGVEGISMGYDIHKKYKENKDGKLGTIKFKKYVAKRVTRGTMGVAGGIGGGVIGQLVIPVPVLGALVGGFVGGIVGSAVGHGQGILLGELIEAIDNKVKDKQNHTKVKETVEESESQERNFNVLQNLVWKFPEGITKPESKIEVESSSQASQLETIAPVDINFVMNAHEGFDHKDYDVYVIDKANQMRATNSESSENIFIQSL
jgi:hypothetical protein